MYVIKYSESALKDIKKLDQQTKNSIINKVREIELSKDPMSLAKPIISQYKNIFRFRIGDFRLVFEKKDRELCLLIILIEPRKKVYQKISDKLKKRL